MCVGGVLTQTSKHLLGEVGSPWDERRRSRRSVVAVTARFVWNNAPHPAHQMESYCRSNAKQTTQEIRHLM